MTNRQIRGKCREQLLLKVNKKIYIPNDITRVDSNFRSLSLRSEIIKITGKQVHQYRDRQGRQKAGGNEGV